MKKIFAILMALVLTFAMSAVAFADGTSNVNTSGWKSDATSFTIKKQYVDANGNETTLYPNEALHFTVTADINNPDTTAIGAVDLNVNSNPDSIQVTVPSYTKVGKYNYTVSETAGNTAGVTYSSNTFGVQVLVSYDYENSKLATQVVMTTGDDAEHKIDTIVNTYKTNGTLEVTKTVAGNLGDQSDTFEAVVTLSSEKPVNRNIEGFTAWNKADTATVYTCTQTITVYHGYKLTISNLPEGITASVAETEGEENMKGYTATYTGNGNAITDGQTTTLAITNTKSTSVDTGITMDSIPYIVLLAVAVVGIAALTMKKRYEA